MRRFVFPAVVGVAVYFAVFGGEYSLLDVYGARSAREAEAAELERVRAEIEALRARVEALESDPEVLERLAREDFGMVRDGEVLYRFVEPSDGDDPERP